MITPYDLHKHLNVYLPFVSDIFAIKSAVTNGIINEQRQAVLTVENPELFAVGYSYHLPNVSQINPCLSCDSLGNGMYNLTFENGHNLITPQLQNDDKTVILQGNWVSAEIVEVVNRYTVTVKSTSGDLFVGSQLWSLDSETAWCNCSSIDGDVVTFDLGDGYVYPCELQINDVIAGQNVYIVDTPERVARVYHDNALNNNPYSLFIVFDKRETIASKDSEAGTITAAHGKSYKEMKVKTDIDLFVVWQQNKADEAHIIAANEASDMVYNVLNACLFGLNVGNDAMQVVPTTSGYSKSTDFDNYIHQFSYQALDTIDIVSGGLYNDKRVAIERLMTLNLNIDARTSWTGNKAPKLLEVHQDYGNI